MEGLAEAIREIQGEAVKAKGAQVVPLADNATLMLCVDGKVEKHSVPPPPRRHSICDLDSLPTFVEGWSEASAWHMDNQVVAILDDGGDGRRENRLDWSLQPSGKFQAITEAAKTLRSHKEFVAFLVQNLRDELNAASPGLLGIIRNLKFRSVDAAEGNVQQGRESMGRQIESEVAGAGDLPETVTVSVRRWAALDHVIEVECLLVLDTQERKLALRPLADEKVQAENSAQDWLHERITEVVQCPVYYGAP